MTNKKQSYYEKNKEKILKQQQDKRNAKYEGLVEGYDYICCKECGFKSSELATHITNKHNITVDEYKIKHNVSSVKAQKSIDRVKGENNPAYQHGGKYSPFSEKYIHGTSNIEKTKKKAKDNKTKDKDSTQIEYWLKKTNNDSIEAEKLLSERQTTFSLEKCITKYGQEEGTEIWLNRQEKWQNTLNLKPDEEKQRINRLKLGNGYSVSNAEREIIEHLKENDIHAIHQFSLFNDQLKKQYIYDISLYNKIIEYNGDYWHCNPTKYNKDYYHKRIHKSAEEIWERDRIKKNYAISKGYIVLTIWENDYKKDKQGTIEKCLNFLKQ